MRLAMTIDIKNLEQSQARMEAGIRLTDAEESEKLFYAGPLGYPILQPIFCSRTSEKLRTRK